MNSDRVERRLAAVMAADIAGYSRLMGADEEGTLAALKAIRRELGDPKIKEHRGRIVKTTGEGCSSSSPASSTRCAARSRCSARWPSATPASPAERRIEFRIGINLGDIIIDEGDIFGDGVNVAARLEALGRAGRDLRQPRRAQPGARQARLRLRGHGRAAGQEHRSAGARPPRLFWEEVCGPSPAIGGDGATTGAGAARQALDRGSAVSEYGGDPEQEYFADGMVEEIITALSRIPWLFVIARNSSFTYKGQTVDVKQVGRELGVRYVLEGSVRKGWQPGAHYRPADRRGDRHASVGRPVRRFDRRGLRASGQGGLERRRRDRAGIAGRRDRPFGRPPDQ